MAKAFKTGDLAAVKRYLKKYPIDEPSVKRMILPSAVSSGNLELIKFLDSLGWVDACRDDESHECKPIHLLALGGSAEMIRYFMSRGFDINEIETSVHSTPLQYAAHGKRFDMVRLLCELGADPNRTYKFPTGGTKETVLQAAIPVVKRCSGLKSMSEPQRLSCEHWKQVAQYIGSGQCRKSK